jgi:hypothetical protein
VVFLSIGGFVAGNRRIEWKTPQILDEYTVNCDNAHLTHG